MPTIGQLLINQKLPPDLRDYTRVWAKSNIKDTMEQVQKRYPNQYKDIIKDLYDIGREVVTTHGDQASISLDDFKKSDLMSAKMLALKKKVTNIQEDDTLDDKAKDRLIVRIMTDAIPGITQDTLDDSVKRGTALGSQVSSGARGNKSQMAQSIVGDMLVSDSKGRPIPVPIFHGYGEGVTPAEYWASSYGARKGAIDIQKGTAKAGFFSKQTVAATHRLRVTEEDCGTTNGVPVNFDDKDSIGSVLASKVGDYGPGTIIDGSVYRSINEHGGKFLVRSPLTCQAKNGVCRVCAGVREKGKLAEIGDNIGISAVQALSEPITQSQLCLAEGTLVRMADWSVKPIEQISVDDWVFGADKDGKTFPVRVVSRYENGQKDCVLTKFRVASSQEFIELVSTPDHKLLATARYWALPHEKKITDILPVAEKCVGYGAEMTKSVDFKDGKHEEFALLLGMLLGDGCYTESVHGVFLSCFDPLLIEDISKYVDSLGMKTTLLAGQKGYFRISQKVDKIRQDPINGRTLAGARNPALIKLLSYEMWGKYAHDKVIPEDVWSWDQSSVVDLISGLFVTDGSVYTTTQNSDTSAAYLAFGSTSLTMIQQLRDLLRVRFAIHTSCIHGSKGKRKRSMYSFVISRRPEVLKFASMIPLYGKKKLALKELLEKWKPVHDKDCSKYYRKEQIPMGSISTYDIEVDSPDHLFVLANGLIVSNSSKHTGGVVGQTAGAVGGFDAINQLVQIPETFKSSAAISSIEGTVTKIEDAPQGGKYISVGSEKHYVSSDQTPSVKIGQAVEEGDVLSDGIPNPSELVKYKGIGEGRKQFVEAFQRTLKNSGVTANRRNVELLARGVINHVEVSDIDGPNGSVMGDVVEYDGMSKTYEPREDSKLTKTTMAGGKYLEKPILHYSIGTRVTPSVKKQLKEFGVNDVMVNDNAPGFKPQMVRIMENLSHTDDWQVRMGGFHLGKGLYDAAQTGSESKIKGNQSFIPALAHGKTFGEGDPGEGF